jgi:hypothetical protein
VGREVVQDDVDLEMSGDVKVDQFEEGEDLGRGVVLAGVVEHRNACVENEPMPSYATSGMGSKRTVRPRALAWRMMRRIARSGSCLVK